MTEHEPQYTILDPKDMVPPEQMHLVPEDTLEPLMGAELFNLRRGGIVYKTVTADTLENRYNIGIRTAYFQMVAHKEGWLFDPDNYQVQFVAPGSDILDGDNSTKRIYGFGLEDDVSKLDTVNVGFETDDDKTFRRMESERTERVKGKLLRFFP